MSLSDYEDEYGGGQRRHRSDRVVRKSILDNAASSISLLVPQHYNHLRLHFAGRSDLDMIYGTLLLRFATGTADSDFDDGENYDWVLLAGYNNSESVQDWGVLELEGDDDEKPKLPSVGMDPIRPLVFSEFDATSINMGSLPAAQTAARIPMTLSMDVPQYAGATFYKGFQSQAAYRLGGTQYQTTRSGHWKEIGPIRAVKVFPLAGNLIAGSMLMIEVS